MDIFSSQLDLKSDNNGYISNVINDMESIEKIKEQKKI